MKTTWRYNFSPNSKISILQKFKMTKHWVDKAVGKQAIYIGGGNAKMVQPLCRGIWQYTTKQLHLFFNSAIPLLGIYEDTLQKYENTYA